MALNRLQQMVVGAAQGICDMSSLEILPTKDEGTLASDRRHNFLIIVSPDQNPIKHFFEARTGGCLSAEPY